MARKSWLDEDSGTTLIDDYARKLDGFVGALADGRIDDHEVADQEKRVVALMKEIEPTLDDKTHERVTQLLCELTAFNIMQLLNEIQEARIAASTTKFRG